MMAIRSTCRFASSTPSPSCFATNGSVRPPPAQVMPVPVIVIEDEAKAKARERREAEAHQNQKDDLIAQQGMNEATQRMAQYSHISMWIITIGTILLLWTLIETCKANRVAQDIVKVTSRLGEAQIRAYLNIKMPQFRFDKNSMSVTVQLENVGQSPAVDVRISGNCTIGIYGGLMEMPRMVSSASTRNKEIFGQPTNASGITEEQLTFLGRRLW